MTSVIRENRNGCSTRHRGDLYEQKNIPQSWLFCCNQKEWNRGHRNEHFIHGRSRFVMKGRYIDMFREMRRKNQVLSIEESMAVLDRGTSGVLAVCGDDGYPYAVPLSYVYHDSKIYFHCAKTGHKLDAIAKNNKVSFCVIDQDMIVPEEYTTYFRSVIIFGKARVLDDEAEKREALEKLAERYSPDHKPGRLQEIDRLFNQVCLVELAVEHMTGKEAIELIRSRQHDK